MSGDMYSSLRPLALSLSKGEAGVFNSLAHLAVTPSGRKAARR